MTPSERAKLLAKEIAYAGEYTALPEIEKAIAEAVEEERRACAEIVRNPRLAPLVMREHLAQAIEARGKKR